tara:strand:- start:11040 stop:11948 length:909 start_codon:yes stop_codon:yes gene_type:complete
LGEANISNQRRKKDEPFNPFARDAGAQRNKRMNERSQSQRRNAPAQRPAPRVQQDTQSAHNELAKRRQEALDRLGTQESKPTPKTAPKPSAPAAAPTFTNSVEKAATPAPKATREDRMAELRRKSEESRKNAKAQRTEPAQAQEVQAEIEIVVAEPVIEFVSAEQNLSDSEEIVEVTESSKPEKSRSDVFKTIQTEISKTSSDRRRKKRRGDKKGGGRQKQEKKLNRQKYLEYKYAARDLLDDDAIAPEHRSNVLGQVWAKGERIGISDALEFIEIKVAEEVLPREVADKLRDLVSRMTTRR